MNLQRVIEETASIHGDKTFLRQGTETLTYQQLLEKANMIGAGLDELTGEGKVAVSSPNSVESILAIISNWYWGNTTVHCNPYSDAKDILHYIEDSGADVLVYHYSIQKKVDKILEEKDIETVRIGGEDSQLDRLEKDRKAPEVEGDYLASLTYTSGTTGVPKGVPFRSNRIIHAATILAFEAEDWEDGIEALEEEIDSRLKGEKPRTEDFPDEDLLGFIREAPRENDLHLLQYPTYHIAGTNPTTATLMAGGTVVLPVENNVENVMDLVENEEITLTGGVPTQLKRMAEYPGIDDIDTSGLRHVHTGGGLLTEEVWRKFRENVSPNLCHEYASSETCEISYSLGGKDVGKPTPVQEVRLVEPGSENPDETVETGERGEVIVNTDGPTVFKGYWKRPDKTKGEIHDGWYFTGDIARQDAEGVISFEGRDDDMIISGGENIAPGKLENLMLEQENVVEAGVVGIEDDKWGHRVVAFVETSGEILEDDLDLAFRESSIADFKRPKEYVFVEEMPLKRTSGVDRKKLREMYHGD